MSAAAELQRILDSPTSTTREEVVLDGKNIDDLAPLLPMLSRLPHLRILKLANNNLTSLPNDLSCLAKVIFLDISRNPVSGLGSFIRGLESMPALRHLYVDLKYESEEDEVIVQLERLDSFNGTPLNDSVSEQEVLALKRGGAQHGGDSAGDPAASVRHRLTTPAPAVTFSGATTWTDQDMAEVQKVYSAANSAASPEEFRDYSANVVRHLKTYIDGEEDPFKRRGEVLKTKKMLFEYCFEEISRSAYRVDPSISDALTTIQDAYGDLLRKYDELVKASLVDRDNRLQVLRVDLQYAAKEVEDLVAQLEHRPGSASNVDWEAEKRGLVEEIGWLRTENERLHNRIRQYDISRERVGMIVEAGDGGVSIGGYPGGGAGDTGFAKSASSPIDLGPEPATRNAPRKELTLRQLKDVIEDIYASKSKFDVKCADASLPKETMEQHLFTYLNQRYGLKSLIKDWAQAIVAAIRKYSSQDNDVSVFDRILRNCVDEEFRFVQRQLKETVYDLLRVYLKGKHPLKGDDEITSMCRKRVGGFVHEEEWVDIVKYMYNEKDSVALIVRIKESIRDRGANGYAPRQGAGMSRRAAAAARQRAAPDNCILYADYLKILLDFQLEGHERFLSKFVKMFRAVDTDHNGVIDEAELKVLLRTLDGDKTDEEVNSLLDLIDPHNNQRITFSECVTFLSSELVSAVKVERERSHLSEQLSRH